MGTVYCAVRQTILKLPSEEPEQGFSDWRVWIIVLLRAANAGALECRILWLNPRAMPTRSPPVAGRTTRPTTASWITLRLRSPGKGTATAGVDSFWRREVKIY